MPVLTTNQLKRPDEGKPIPLRHVRADDIKPAVFDLTGGQFKDAKPHPSAFGRGPIQTSQLRDMAENKKRLAVSAAKKAAAQAEAATVSRKGKAKKSR
jgi:hypothetical protein